MPTITIRLSKDEKAALEDGATSAGVSLSAYVRDMLDFAHTTRPNFDAWLDDHEKRIAAIERLVER